MSSCDLRVTLESLERAKVKEYFFRPLPDTLDDRLVNCLRQYAAGSNQKQEEMRSLVSAKHSYGLLAFAERMAVLAVRELSSDRVYLGLLAITLENYNLDAREDLMVLAVLLNSARKTNSDSTEIFEAAARCASEQTGQSLRQFVQERKDDPKILERMGYKEILVDGLFSYTRQ